MKGDIVFGCIFSNLAIIFFKSGQEVLPKAPIILDIVLVIA